MFNDIIWTTKGNEGICIWNSEKVNEFGKRFSQRHWTFRGPGDEKEWNGTLPYTLEGKWDSTAAQMVERFKDTGHPVLKECQYLESWNPEKEEWQPYTSMRMLRTVSSYSETFML